MDDDDFVELSRRFMPKETASYTMKCVKLFEDEVSARKALSSSADSVPAGILPSDDHQQLSNWLCKICAEAWK